MRCLYCWIMTLFIAVSPARAEPTGTVVNIHPSSAQDNKQGLPQFVGISGTNSGAKSISMNKVLIPPRGSAKAHTHSNFESVIYVLKGRVKTYFGNDLKESVVSEEGDFIYIPPDVPHYPVNLSTSEPAIGIVARTDADEQEHVILYPSPQQP